MYVTTQALEISKKSPKMEYRPDIPLLMLSKTLLLYSDKLLKFEL